MAIMDRDDADQEGITLPPTNSIRMIAREEALRVIDRHTEQCPFSLSRVEYRVRCLEISYGRLIGFLLGAGILGGTAGGIVSKLLP